MGLTSQLQIFCCNMYLCNIFIYYCIIHIRILVAQNGDFVSQVYFVSSESPYYKDHDVMFSDSRLDLLILSEPDEALDSLHQAKTDEELKFLDELEAFETNTLHLVVG